MSYLKTGDFICAAKKKQTKQRNKQNTTTTAKKKKKSLVSLLKHLGSNYTWKETGISGISYSECLYYLKAWMLGSWHLIWQKTTKKKQPPFLHFTPCVLLGCCCFVLQFTNCHKKPNSYSNLIWKWPYLIATIVNILSADHELAACGFLPQNWMARSWGNLKGKYIRCPIGG